MVTSLYLHFAHICSLPALLSIGTYPPFFIIAYRQVNPSGYSLMWVYIGMCAPKGYGFQLFWS